MARRRINLGKDGIKNIVDRFTSLHEYTYITKPVLTEDDEDINNNEEEPTDEVPNMDGEEQANVGEPSVEDNIETEEEPIDNAGGGEEDVVINIDDLVQSQKNTEEQVINISDRISELNQIVQNFNKALELISSKTEDLKNEFEKRLPTDIETLTMRSLSSFPFDKNIDKYWDEKQKNSNYRVVSSETAEPKEYVIRKSDIYKR